MASAFSHAFVAVVMGKIFVRGSMPLRFWVLSILCSILPDADVIGFAFGIRYGDWLGHRGFSHSLLFALLVAGVIVWLAFRKLSEGRSKAALIFYFFLVTASHGFLDALTNGGLGIAFFSPLDTTRYFFPYRPVEVSPIGLGAFFSSWGAAVMLSELLWIWLPVSLILVAVVGFRRMRAARQGQYR